MQLDAKQLSKTFGKKTVIDQLHFQLTPGIYGFLGANGSGKTTLMRILATVAHPSSGSVTLNGENIFKLGETYRDLIGYLPQNIGYYQHFSAKKFLHYMATIKGLTKEESVTRTEDLLEKVGLQDVGKKKIKTFSGGMKQRVGIAQALLNNPKIVLVDEPTVGLDPKERIRFRNLLASMAQDKIVLISTHIVSDIETIAKEVLVLKQGRLLAQAPPATLVDEMRGRVWEILCSQSEALQLEATQQTTNITPEGNEARVRFLADQHDVHGASEVTPTLEDYYLYHFDRTEVVS
ncbi:ABC transporter ATP-binding protein [Bacillus fonticola]|uniref:ABC transporter ATP-binding protein n=1 Tax=Bacillus fonticola TaxID=2728853 RepID=UPI0014727141|nr:ABC transporter ATP-binding protein [Bacillus fonticola]